MKLPVVLLPGALGAAPQFDELRAHFAENEAVYAFSLSGHGNSAPDAPFSMSLFAASLLRFLDDHNLPKVNIFGYSMGGYIALYVAALYPDRVSAVATYGTKLDWSPAVADQMKRMFDPEKIALKAPQLAESLAVLHADWQALCRYTADFLVDLGNGQGLQDGMFANITCPVSIGRGTEDHVVGLDESLRVAQMLKFGKLVEIPGGKHQMELVDSNILFKFVEEVLV